MSDNPLLAQRQDSTTGITGIGLAESATDLQHGIESGSWSEIALGGVGTGLEALSMAIDPVGTLARYAVSWLMEHVKPLSDALDWLAGDPDQIAAYAASWNNVSTSVGDVAQDFLNEVNAITEQWTGAAADAYRKAATDQAHQMKAAASAAGGIGSAVELAGTLVGIVRTFVRELVSECVATLIARIPQWVAEIGGTLGVATPHVVASAVTLISRWVTKITDLITKLTRSLDKLSPLLRRLGDLWDQVKSSLIKAIRGGDAPAGTSPAGAHGHSSDGPALGGPDSTTPSGHDAAGDASGPGGAGSRGGPDRAGPEVGGDQVGGQRTDGNGGCDGKGGDPVDAISGQVIANGVDVDLPSLLPLVLQRGYASGYAGGRLHGPGWSSTVDQRIEVDHDSVRYFGDDAQVLHYQPPGSAGVQRMPDAGARWPLTWDQDSGTYRVEDPKSGWVRHFAPAWNGQRVRPITALSDRNGNRIDYRRDQRGVPTEVVHSGGYRILVDHSDGPDGPLVTGLRLASDGTTLVEYRYDPRGRLTEILDETRLPYCYEYDDADRIAAWVDRAGYRYTYTYGPDGRVVTAQGQDGYLSSRFDYDLEARRTTVTDSLGNSTVFHYDEHNHLTEVLDPLGNAEFTEYDRFHRLLSRTDALGHTTRHTLGWDGDVVRIDRPDGTAVTATYDEIRQPTGIVGPGGERWQYTYDARGNTVTCTDPAGAVTTYTYGDRGEPRTITDALGNITTVTTNDAGLPTAVTDPVGATETYELDARGRLTRITNPLGAVTTIDWSRAGTPARYTYPDGTSESWITDGNGDIIAASDRSGLITRFLRGPFHSISRRIEPDGTEHHFVYDTELRLTHVTSPAELTWQYRYDPAGNLIEEQDFNGRVVRYGHDPAQRLTSLANDTDETITITRDALGRALEQRTGHGEVTTFGYDRAGRVVIARGPDAEVQLQRNELGQVLADTVNGRTTTNTYDPLGRRTSRTTPGGHRSDWRYNGAGLPTMLATGAQRIEFRHDASGREIFRQWSPQTALANAWDTAGRLASRQIIARDAMYARDDFRPRFSRSWTYRPDGAPIAVTDTADGPRRFDLDQLGRVTAVRAANWTERYAYDAAGNLGLAVDSRLPQDPESGRVTATGTLVTTAGRTRYEYDQQGRLVRTTRRTLSGRQQVFSYRYDVRNRLIETRTPTGDRWSYQYDPLGRRISKKRLAPDDSALEEIRFHWDGEVLAEQEHRSRGGQVATTTWDHEPGTWRPISQHHRTSAADAPQHVIDERFHAIITDLVGTPTELVTTDGRIDWHQQASLWGKEVHIPARIDCPLRFPGQYLDRETGLHYNHHRYYDPATARYTTPDPLGLDPAPNHHSYVANPLVLIDPLGLISRDRYQHLDRDGWRNYTLQDSNTTTYYSGLFGPGSTQADVERRHADNHNRYTPGNGDAIEVQPGQRTYGESRLMEQRLAEQHGTVIGRDGDNYRGNRQNPLAGDKLAEYEEYENRKNTGLGCP